MLLHADCKRRKVLLDVDKSSYFNSASRAVWITLLFLFFFSAHSRLSSRYRSKKNAKNGVDGRKKAVVDCALIFFFMELKEDEEKSLKEYERETVIRKGRVTLSFQVRLFIPPIIKPYWIHPAAQSISTLGAIIS